MNDYSVFDIEADNLLDDITRIHCMTVNEFKDGTRRFFTMTDYSEIRAYLYQATVLVGHKIITYDIPALEKILGISITARLIDTLGISWYLEPQRKVHGLAEWGRLLGIEKPPIENWESLPLEEYIKRCEADVQINTLLWDKQLRYLLDLYSDRGNLDGILYYISFKLDCAREQEELRWKLDAVKCQQGLDELILLRDEKFLNLKAIMPQIIKYKTVTPPKVMYKKDGSLSAHGHNWITTCIKYAKSPDYMGEITVEDKRVEPNPGSPQQLKDFLFSVGWQPQTFKTVVDKNEDGSVKQVRQVPQIMKDDNSGDICESIPVLYDAVPELVNLESLGIIKHRIGILEGFLRNMSEDGYVKAEVAGFTNTMRFKHAIIVNLPKIIRPYGKYARGCLTCPEGYTLCGSDMSSLEDTTKQHYMYYFDPQYVTEMRVPGFDPHIDICVIAKMISEDDKEFFKIYDKNNPENTDYDKGRYKFISDIRGEKGKKTNFSAVYGAGAPKIAFTAKITLEEAQVLHKAYWIRNKAVKQVAAAVTTKTTAAFQGDGLQMWLYNPISQFWYTLRADKDRFSTLNQGTGVYVFDNYVQRIRSRGIKICGQFHDEVAFPLPLGKESVARGILNECIQEVNDKLHLNVPLGISVDFGQYYADIH